MTSIVNWLLC